jgi:cell division protein FtsB
MNIDINDMKSQVASAKDALQKKQIEIEKTKAEIDSFELNEETIKKIARERLGLRENDTIIFENSQPN